MVPFSRRRLLAIFRVRAFRWTITVELWATRWRSWSFSLLRSPNNELYSFNEQKHFPWRYRFPSSIWPRSLKEEPQLVRYRTRSILPVMLNGAVTIDTGWRNI